MSSRPKEIFDVVHLDMQIAPEYVAHAFNLLRSGGYLACYTPFLEQMAIVVDAAGERFGEVHTHELIEREMTRSKRGNTPVNKRVPLGIYYHCTKIRIEFIPAIFG